MKIVYFIVIVNCLNLLKWKFDKKKENLDENFITFISDLIF